MILFYRLRKRGARRRPSKREGSWQRVRIWNEEEETQKDSREVWERNCRLETCWRCSRKGDHTAMRQFFKSLSWTKMKVETCIRLHCQTASMWATISKHYLPHLSAITTFFSVEYVAKVITISRINAQKKFTVQTFAQKLYCFKHSPLGGASIHCKHLQF